MVRPVFSCGRARAAGGAGAYLTIIMLSLSERCATHEAAHAVIGRVLKLPCGGATIVPDGLGFDGHAVVATALAINNDLIERGDYRDFRSAVLDKLMVCLAGPEAEAIAFGDADARGDVRQIERLCARYYISTADVERLRPQVHALLLRHWDKVEAVAAALLQKETLSALEIDAIIPAT
jgi:ATP-dependent Zn protease